MANIYPEWDRAYELTIPLLGLGISAFSVAMAIMAVSRSSPLEQRIYYQDGQYLVSVRYPGQWHDLRDFIQPNGPDMIRVRSQIGPDVWALYDFVCRNIDYRRDTGEFWLTPSETLKGYGDCEDTSILLTSLLRNFTNAHVALGTFQGLGHAWVVKDGQIYETTYTFARPVPDPEDYKTFAIFNDLEVVELWPGGLGELFAERRDEATKLNLMAEMLANHG